MCYKFLWLVLNDSSFPCLFFLQFCCFFLAKYLVGGGDSRRKGDSDYTNKGGDSFDTNPTHRAPDSPSDTNSGNDNVLIMNTSNEDRTTSFFAQPGILAGKYQHVNAVFVILMLFRTKLFSEC